MKTTSRKLVKESTTKFVGESVLRKEGIQKLTGDAKYIDDVKFPNMLYGATIRSKIPRGKIKNVTFKDGASDKFSWQDFIIVDYKDIPGENYVALIEKDQPYLASEKINHAEEPILLLAHEDKDLLEEARRLIEVEVEKEEPLLTLKDSLEKIKIIKGSDNVLKSYLVEKGDIEKALKEADMVIEGVYETGLQEQLYIENNGMIAVFNKKDGITVWGSMQCPYYVQKAVTNLFNLPPEKVRIVQMETGGGFGGKEDFPSILAGHAALLSYKAGGRPVKMIYDRSEDMAVTTKRHPSFTRHKTAVNKDGKIIGMDIEFYLDGGAYLTLSSVVLSRGLLHATGPYFTPNVKITAKALMTNNPPNGAFRGFGAPQSVFAIERHMEKIARAVGITSENLRKKNFLKDGDTTATKQIINDKVDLKKLVDHALKESDFLKKRNLFDKENRKDSQMIKKGIGLSCFMHGAGFTGSGEKYLASVAGVTVGGDGRIKILAANTEMGQGKNTVFSQIAADALGISVDLIDVVQPDTAVVPNSGPTVASRTTMIVGKLVETAAKELKERLQDNNYLQKKGYSDDEFSLECKKYIKKNGELKILKRYDIPPEIKWDEERYEGDAYGTFAWAVYIAEVSIDLVTFQTKVERFTALQEVGKVVNPILAEGQIEGGVAQGIGYALYEKVICKEGRVINNGFTNYIVLTSDDTPDIKVLFEESPYRHGPQGAKGIGELPLDGTAPAIMNAIEHALGCKNKNEFNYIPFLPEDLFSVLEKN